MWIIKKPDISYEISVKYTHMGYTENNDIN